jgi:hypothetical protein
MAAPVVSVHGVPQAQAHLRGVGERAEDLTRVMETEARWAQQHTTGVPSATGRLAASVAGGTDSVLEADAEGYVIGSSVPYARFVFRGTRYMDAQPPVPPPAAADHAARAISRELENAR